jgi:hypothetical protein
MKKQQVDNWKLGVSIKLQVLRTHTKTANQVNEKSTIQLGLE